MRKPTMPRDTFTAQTPGLLAADAAGPGSNADANAMPSLAGCEVTEYDTETGQKEWNDSVFVQDFTDSVLATAPAPIDLEIG